MVDLSSRVKPRSGVEQIKMKCAQAHGYKMTSSGEQCCLVQTKAERRRRTALNPFSRPRDSTWDFQHKNGHNSAIFQDKLMIQSSKEPSFQAKAREIKRIRRFLGGEIAIFPRIEKIKVIVRESCIKQSCCSRSVRKLCKISWANYDSDQSYSPSNIFERSDSLITQ